MFKDLPIEMKHKCFSFIPHHATVAQLQMKKNELRISNDFIIEWLTNHAGSVINIKGMSFPVRNKEYYTFYSKCYHRTYYANMRAGFILVSCITHGFGHNTIYTSLLIRNTITSMEELMKDENHKFIRTHLE